MHDINPSHSEGILRVTEQLNKLKLNQPEHRAILQQKIATLKIIMLFVMKSLHLAT
jgi:hypothetical protein